MWKNKECKKKEDLEKVLKYPEVRMRMHSAAF